MRKIFIFSLALSVLALLTAGCGKDGHHDAHWSYKGKSGPNAWSSLKTEYAACKSGKKQSPVDLSGPLKSARSDLKVNYSSSNLNIVNNGHTYQVNYKGKGSMTAGGKTYKLLQFHFHSPSEHTINGKPADLVAHMVHKSSDGQLAVIGVLFKKGKENAFLAPLWKNMPATEGHAQLAAGINYDVNKLLPEDKSYYNYSGSLTTPPCSEGVNWFVMRNLVSVSEAQIAAFTKIFPKSVRPVQARNDRQYNMTN